jgi:hypothetical protein
MNNVGFRYGVLGDSLEEQANAQGYTLGEEGDKFEKIRKAINMCMFHVATESQVKIMTEKLHKKVVGALEILENEEEI